MEPATPTGPNTPTPQATPPPPAPDIPVTPPQDSVGEDEGITPVTEATDNATVSKPAVEPAPSDSNSQASSIDHSTTPNQQLHSANQPKKSGLPPAAIIIAIIVFLALVVVAVMIYMNSNKTTPSTTPTTTTQTTTPTTTAAKSSDIDDTVTSLDKSLKSIDDSKDFSSSDLSSSSLSL